MLARVRFISIATVVFVLGGLATSAYAGDDVGLVNPSTAEWRLRDSGGDVLSFVFGNPGDVAIMGDWNCNGISTPGMYRQSTGLVYLRNSNTTGNADILFFFGDPGDVPIVGDFNGDNCDTVSIYRPSTQAFHIINKLGVNNGGLGAADVSYLFGDPGDRPFVGDFNGNGTETVGLHRESTGLVYFRQTHTQGNADAQFIFGDPGDKIVAGDWNDNTVDSPSLYRSSVNTVFFRFTNTQGNADQVVYFGNGNQALVSGEFGNLSDSFSNDVDCAMTLLSLSNAERAKEVGMAPLVWDAPVAAVAAGHSRAMVLEGFFSHDAPHAPVTFTDRLNAAGIVYGAAGENIAVNNSGCSALHDQWMGSPPHRANILNPAYKKAGYGVVSVAGFMGTQMFTD